MWEILSQYKFLDVVFFLVLFASAIMGLGRFLEFTIATGRKFFRKEAAAKENEERLGKMEKDILKNTERNEAMLDSMEFFADRLDILVDSDKDNIKAYLTDKHHYYVYTQKWIDDYNLDCIERRFVHYKKAGGNSFVNHLMEELRALPTQPPESE